jgi:murein DD-endopeptidase MepM/ murein hydrolase activator NlpD
LQDDTLDPLQFNKLKKGAMLALRGTAFNNLSDDTYLGCADKFSLSAPAADESLEFDADYLADDVNSLGSVEVYARYKKGSKVKIVTVPSSAFTIRDAKSDYPRATIKIPLATILSALKITAKDMVEEDVIIVESDLILKDGSIILAASIVNSSLFEVAQFYPAQIVRYLAIK